MKTPRFPEEILDIIVGLVATSSPDPSKTLAALALASRSMNRISTPYLYSKITVSGRKSLTRLLPLAYTLFKHPEYAAMVKVFVLEGKYRTKRDHVSYSCSSGEEYKSFSFSGYMNYSDGDDPDSSGSSYTSDGDYTDDEPEFILDNDSSDSDDEESGDENGEDDEKENSDSDDADDEKEDEDDDETRSDDGDGYVHRPPRRETWRSLPAVTRKKQPIRTKILKTRSSRSWPKKLDVTGLCRSALKRAGYHCGPDLDLYITHMKKGNESMILSALLPSLPNLRRLQRVLGSKRAYFVGDDLSDLLHDLVLRRHPFNKNVLPFQNLTDVVIDRIEEEERPKYVHPRILALLSGFPNLRNIYANKLVVISIPTPITILTAPIFLMFSPCPLPSNI
jgi:hypothetical protein